jgi:regulator of protease activity HflC (stomatin/prohibitin superfamily)
MIFGELSWSLLPVVIIVGAFILSAIKIFAEYERGVIFRLGRITSHGPVGPGLCFVIPIIDRVQKVDLRVVTMDVPPQDVITKDNVTLKVNAVLYFRVIDPTKAIIEIENFLYATSQLAQTTLRSVMGQVELDDLLAKRDQLNAKLQSILDDQTEPWGVKVTNVEIKNVDLPIEMQRAMARQAEAERERRAKIIAAEGEMQASEKLRDASNMLSESPSALQLRYLQTLVEISSENNTTTVFPIPLEFIKAFTPNIKV